MANDRKVLLSEEILTEYTNEIGLQIFSMQIDKLEYEKFASIDSASENSICYMNYKNFDTQKLKTFKGLVLIDHEIWIENHQNVWDFNYICVEDPKYLFAYMFQRLTPKEESFQLKRYDPEVHFFVDKSAQISESARIHPSVEIGKNSLISDGVCIHGQTLIGDNVVIKENSVIGGAGFGYAVRDGYPPIHMPHLGGVVIQENVHVGSCNTIDRGSFGNTLIGKNAKLDNGIHVGHNSTIGENTIITAHVEISGSVHIGSNSWIAPNVSIREKVIIGNNVLIGIGSVVIKNVENNIIAAGVPARPIRTRN